MPEIDKKRFKNASGLKLTKALFFETNIIDKSQVVYTLKDHDHLGFPSLYRLYMEEEDLIEFDFANKHLDSYQHWEELCNCEWFKDHVSRWRKELHLKIQSKALKAIKAKSRTDSKDALAAQRYLLERGWEPKNTDTNRRGRPSKEEIKKEAIQIAENDKMLDEAAKRIGMIN